MARDISSAQTFLMKVIFPAVWIALFGFGTLCLWLNKLQGAHGPPPPNDLKWPFLLVWATGTAFIMWLSFRLKRVRVDSDKLYISNYLKEVSTPLKNICGVTENRWINIHPVTRYFPEPTAFGRTITFMPRSRVFGFWTSHPVVEEL